MSKFDIVSKIKPKDLLFSLFKKNCVLPYKLLQKEFNLPGHWQENYFSWGRNALYYFFKNLPFQEIVFPGFICPTLTRAAEKAGKKVILTEIDLDSFNLNIGKIPPKTKCLYVVHTFGNPVNIKKIRQRFKGIFIIEDCAHALFSQLNNQFVGSSGDVILFSLYKQVANINGALLIVRSTSEDTVRQPWKLKQNQESSFKYLKRLIFKISGLHQWLLNIKRQQYLPQIEQQELSTNMPSKIAFNLFSNGFKKLKTEVEKRRKIAEWYKSQIKKSPYFKAQKASLNSKPSYYFFNLYLKPQFASLRDKLGLTLRQNNIFPGRLWFDAPITSRKYKLYQKKCPNALILAKTILNLPIKSCYSKDNVKELFHKINKILKNLLKIRN